MAAEFAPRGIRVNQITPGAARTPVWNPHAAKVGMDALEEKLKTTIPLGRISEAHEVATVALFLASSDSSNVVGAEIDVDGGATRSPLGAPAHRENWQA
ncbi:SDR family oxidoreductase [Pseudomonas sp. MDT2-39-1]|uniref:SDR family oxidoreductase n=1 Tax=Pseudomonas sp. BGI-2 TaxID=2528211 RepID=UPI002115C2A6|nr:SDR family oxidoreductase [Pseudomonas sp. BGI-2]